MKIYLITDCDDKKISYAYQNRNNAIFKMYQDCKKYGAILSTSVLTNNNQNQTLGQLFGNDENKKLEYLYSCTNKEINNIFYCYWYFQEIQIEDAD